MRWKLGGLLIIASVLLMAVTVLEVIRGRSHGRQLHVVDLLLTGTLAVPVFLAGRHLWQHSPAEQAEAMTTPGAEPLRLAARYRSWLLVLYLGGVFVIAVFAAYPFVKSRFLQPLSFLVWPGWISIFVVSFVFPPKTNSVISPEGILVAIPMLYFLILLYPLYRILAMDRAVEMIRYRRMKTIQFWFMTIHLTIALFFFIWMTNWI